MILWIRQAPMSSVTDQNPPGFLPGILSYVEQGDGAQAAEWVELLG